MECQFSLAQGSGTSSTIGNKYCGINSECDPSLNCNWCHYFHKNLDYTFVCIRVNVECYLTFVLKKMLFENLQAKKWQNVMNTSIYIQYNTIQSRAAFSLLWLVAINSSLICTQCWHHLQTNASFSLFSMVVSISMFTPLMLADNADKICG